LADGRPTHPDGAAGSPRPPSPWRRRLAWALAGLWAAQLLLVAWNFAPEVDDLARRLLGGRVGQAVRDEDPFHRWLASLTRLIPPQATYLFLDTYETGKEMEARYHLFPRRHVLLPPPCPPGYLFHAILREKPAYLILRDQGKPLGPGLEAALAAGLVRIVPLPGPGRVFRVQAEIPQAGFYD